MALLSVFLLEVLLRQVFLASLELVHQEGAKSVPLLHCWVHFCR